MAEPEVPFIAGWVPVFESAFGVSQARLHRSELVLFPQVVTSLWRVHLRLCNPCPDLRLDGGRRARARRPANKEARKLRVDWCPQRPRRLLRSFDPRRDVPQNFREPRSLF